MSLTYSAPALEITLKIIDDCGLDSNQLMVEVGIDPAKRSDPNARYNYAKVDELWFIAASRISDDSFGLKAARFWHPSQLGALGYGWLTSSTLRTAFARFSSYMRILTEGACLRVEDFDDEVRLLLTYNEISRQQPTRTDSFMAMLLVMCRVNWGDSFSPKYICLTHSEPDNTAAFYALFKCPIYFSCSDNSFVVSSDDAVKPLTGSNPYLAQINDRVMIEYVAMLDKDDIAARVKKEITMQLAGGGLSDSSVADALHMSVRTMQRKLGEQQSSFKLLLNDVRKELADKFIRNSSMTISEISYCLGFAESSSFSRYFKRMSGYSPSQLRNTLS